MAGQTPSNKEMQAYIENRISLDNKKERIARKYLVRDFLSNIEKKNFTGYQNALECYEDSQEILGPDQLNQMQKQLNQLEQTLKQ